MKEKIIQWAIDIALSAAIALIFVGTAYALALRFLGAEI